MDYDGTEKRTSQGDNIGRRITDKEDMDLFPAVHEHSVIALVQLIHNDVKNVKLSLNALDDKLDGHMRDETTQLAEAIASIMNKSFPEGDPHGHRKHHELAIKAAEDKAAFWQDIASSTAKWGLFGFFTWLVYAAWKAFLLGPK
jgi:hypothetical protein